MQARSAGTSAESMVSVIDGRLFSIRSAGRLVGRSLCGRAAGEDGVDDIAVVEGLAGDAVEIGVHAFGFALE